MTLASTNFKMSEGKSDDDTRLLPIQSYDDTFFQKDERRTSVVNMSQLVTFTEATSP